MSVDFFKNNREKLLKIYGQIYSANQPLRVINEDISEEDFEKDCCVDTIAILKYACEEVDFPINYDEMGDEDLELAFELHSIILCEEEVAKGKLIRDGIKYTPVKNGFPLECDREKYGVFLS